MNKIELAEKMAEKLGVTKKQAEDMLNTFEEIVTETLKTGGEVTLTGFGTFMTKKREARMGVNPQKPGEKIQIPAVTVPKFKAGKSLKDALKMTGGSMPAPAAPATPAL
ncbi:MAG: HU family DNA-binding protein [Candidatus Kerfeldbacteria bacterium]|nr:HU family DNA-binding protein [Candidatus Kerfeldbacteria bacterium]